MAKLRPLTLELLEDRTVPTPFWPQARYLTLSLVQDGTPIVDHGSTLFQTLDGLIPDRDVWQNLLVQAFQTWAVQANISVGLRADSPDAPLGVAGRFQGDPRFGDIRIAAQPMPADTLAVAVPPDPFLAGTLAGDVFLNSSPGVLTPDNLFRVLLHEAGHVFGLEDNDNPDSIMFRHLPTRDTPSEGDIAALQGVYGARLPENLFNDTCDRATQIALSGIDPEYDGSTPLVVYGDLNRPGDIDRFWIRPFEFPGSHTGYSGPMTFQLQTAGISFLPPRLTVYSTRGNDCRTEQVMDQQLSTDWRGSVLTVTLPSVDRRFNYHAAVSSAVAGPLGVGRYALAVTFDDAVNPDYAARLDEVLRGRFADLSPEDRIRERAIAQLFRSPASTLFEPDFHTNDTLATAQVLPSLWNEPQQLRNTHYEALASIEDETDVDFYRVQAPQFPDGRPIVLTVTLLAEDVHGLVPVVYVYDANGQPLPARDIDVVLNGNGTFAIQTSDILRGSNYFLRVAAADPGPDQTGNYTLLVDFGSERAGLETFTDPTDLLNADRPEADYALYVGQSQLFQLVLDAGDRETPQDGRVHMDLLDDASQVLFSLEARAGRTVSGPGVFLVPGAYRVRFTATGSDGGPPPQPLAYRLRGLNLTDPVGPALEDPLLEPMFGCPGQPGLFCYPGSGDPTPRPFFFLLTA